MKYSSIELTLPADCVEDFETGGSKDSVVDHWLRQPDIAVQFEKLTLEDSARILYGYGAWEVDELRDLETNKQRILWLAASDIADTPKEERYLVRKGEYSTTLEGHGYDAELAELQ